LRAYAIVAVVIFALLSLTGFFQLGCELGSDCEDTVSENESLNQENTQLQQELKSLRSDYESLSSDWDKVKQDFDGVKADYQNVLEGSQSSELRNPTWQELKTFLDVDEIDGKEYITDKFDCEGFTIGLRDNAWKRGFRCAYIAIGFGEGNTGHALNAFETQDKGLVYIDNTEHDAVGYLEVGKVYGTIALDGVRVEFIDTTGEPNEFWNDLAYTRYNGDLFGYGYYDNFIQRRDFYEQSIDAYNAEVDNYNSAVIEFNNDNSTYSLSHMENWEVKLLLRQLNSISW